MRKFFIKLLAFLILLIVVDYCAGEVISFLRSHAKYGETDRIYHIQNKAKEDVLIFGSSRALDHYFPAVLEQELEMSCYNCGEDAHGIVYFYTLMNIIREKHIPKIIIYDLYVMDLFESDITSQLTILKPLWGNDCLDSILIEQDEKMRFKMFSQMYKYNSMIYSVLFDNLRNSNLYDQGAYVVMDGEMSYEQIKRKTPDNTHNRIDSHKLYFFEKFIIENKDVTKLIFVLSPLYGAENSNEYKPLFEIINKYDIPLINHYSDTTFINHSCFFANPSHMNNKGANIYSRIICKEIKELLK